MHMDDGEIIRSYQAAKNHRDQVQILADLNNVSRPEMAKWLVRPWSGSRQEAAAEERGCGRAWGCHTGTHGSLSERP